MIKGFALVIESPPFPHAWENESPKICCNRMIILMRWVAGPGLLVSCATGIKQPGRD